MKRSIITILLLPFVAIADDTNALPQLAPAYGELSPTFWEQHHIAIIIGSIAFLIFTLLLITLFMLRPETRAAIPPEAIARKALVKLQGQSEDGKVLSEISQILRRYLGAVLGLSAAGMTTTECFAALHASPKISADLVRMISSFLRECDGRKFAPTPPASPPDYVPRALTLVELTEKHLRSAAPPRAAALPPPYIPTRQPPPMVSTVTQTGNKPAP